jgi:hypothetical protein
MALSKILANTGLSRILINGKVMFVWIVLHTPSSRCIEGNGGACSSSCELRNLCFSD